MREMYMEFRHERSGPKVIVSERFTKLPNELLSPEYLRKLSSLTDQVHLLILRETLGWGVSETQMSIGQISTILGSPRTSIARSLQVLEANRIITRRRNGTHTTTIALVLDPSRLAPTASSLETETSRDKTETSVVLKTETSDQPAVRAAIHGREVERQVKTFCKDKGSSVFPRTNGKTIAPELVNQFRTYYPDHNMDQALRTMEAFCKQQHIRNQDEMVRVLRIVLNDDMTITT
jgi:predicted transcriptional regulator